MKEYKQDFEEFVNARRIRKSTETFKIKLFFGKGENSLLIAKHVKNIKPTKDQPKKLYWNYWAITISYYYNALCSKITYSLKGL